jgi:hypothetical protein
MKPLGCAVGVTALSNGWWTQAVEPRAGRSTRALEIRRSDLDAGAVRSILDQLRRTGKLVLGGSQGKPIWLFVENQSNDNASIMSEGSAEGFVTRYGAH